ncbi:TPA: hypothetical protein SCV07_001101 [Campylobacter lari]|uniref:hypothetical protein n=1 Tax=Campylobacter sp. W0066.2 TaxID=2735752 RepID=UPI00298473AD|nr:FapA family protein [Campylobacter sp. W0066.2]HEG2581763.1 hypothetical protein [Campylobacter lari]
MLYFKELNKNNVDQDYLDEDITVENNNQLESCIKSGVCIKARNVFIKGNVEQSNIIASSVFVEGQTHSRSEIKASSVYIKHCKGSVIADCVFIETLEGGVIKAKKVYVDICGSGKIIADFIYIGKCLSYNELYAKQYLVFEEVEGNMNTFEINPEKFLHEINSKNFFQKQLMLEQLNSKLKYVIEQLDEAKAYIVNNCHNIYKIKNLNKKNIVYKRNIELYNRALTKYQNQFNKYKDVVKLFYVVNTQVDSVLNMAFNGKIILKKYNKGTDNLIKFTIIGKKNRDYRYILKNDYCKVFYLQNRKKPNLRFHTDLNQEDLLWIEKIKKCF